MQQRAAQKEETIRKYEELLRQAREDMTTQNQRHENEMRILQAKLHSKNDAAFDKYRKAAQDAINQPSSSAPSNIQVCFIQAFAFTYSFVLLFVCPSFIHPSGLV